MAEIDFDNLEKYFEELPIYQIEIGVISDHKERKEEGVTNAELMYIHEKGSPLHHIPSRPVLELTLKHTEDELLEKTIGNVFKNYIESNFNLKEIDNTLNKLCMRMENYAREIIYSNDGRLVPNSPAVSAAKGGNHPLFDTGQLARSITCRLNILKK